MHFEKKSHVVHSEISSGFTNLSILRGGYQPDLYREEALADIFEETSMKFPDTVAIIFESSQLTYQQLNSMAERAASFLREIGARPGRIIGLWMARGINLLIFQLAIVKTGAAWLPLDMDTPLDRVCVCLNDADAMALVTEEYKMDNVHRTMLTLGLKDCEVVTDTLLLSCNFSSQSRRQATPANTAYVIYTSGSTGKPKGIVISNRSICHFLRSENTLLKVRHGDRVYQGFSVSFDMSFEEIWISYMVGATLWVAPKDIAFNPEEIPLALIKHQITVFHSVPTLLALFQTDVPNLRIINLGGEMCPVGLVEKWTAPWRSVFNTYGPTEATVSATLKELKRDEAVTIGKPLPNYDLMVIDSNALPDLRLLPRGETGELCISGPGVAVGYMGRPELTSEKFLANPWAETELDDRLYRTGDLAYIDENFQIQCSGRVDDQVKVRGYRVELGEIEAVLCKLMGVGTVAVVLRRENNVEQLVAYVVPSIPESFSPSSSRNNTMWRSQLVESLPVYMVPSRFELMESMPRLPSGKIDRNALKARPIPDSSSRQDPTRLGADIMLRNDTEKFLYSILQRLFPGQQITATTDFFTDLGGNSLFAAQLVSALRSEPRYAHATIRDVYSKREFGAIADGIHAKISVAHPHTLPHALPKRISLCKYWVCGFCQAIALILIRGLAAGFFLAPFAVYFISELDDIVVLVLALAVYLASLPVSFLVAFLGKWVVLGRLKPGRYPLWGVKYFQIWLADHLRGLAPLYLISGTPFYPMWLRALGASVGKDVYIGEMKNVRAPDLLSIGSYSSIAIGASFENIHVERGEVVVGAIDIGEHCYVGQAALLEGNTKMENWAHLQHQSSLMSGAVATLEGVWSGCPAQLVGMFNKANFRQEYGAGAGGRVFEYCRFLLGMVLIALLFYLPIFPSYLVICYINDSDGWIYGTDIHNYGNDDDYPLSDWNVDQLSVWIFSLTYIASLPVTFGFTVVFATCAVLLRWITLPRLLPGSWPLHSTMYFQKWLVDLIVSQSNVMMQGAYATLYTPVWLRWLGATIGTNTEISFSFGMVPELLTMGDESFSADAVCFSSTTVDGGVITLGNIAVGKRSFLGNQCNVFRDTVIPENCLIGVMTQCPTGHVCKEGETWVGSPPIQIPVREVVAGYPDYLTFKPSLERKIIRGTVELWRMMTPAAFSIAFNYTYVVVLEDAWSKGLMLKFFLLYLSSGVVYGLVCFVWIAFLKWIFLWFYETSVHPMATLFVWTSEAITSMYESMLVPSLFKDLTGTPWLPFFLRLLGCRIGSGVYINTTDVTEWDCVQIGDYSEIESFVNLQTHLFEDRLMKIGVVMIGNLVTMRAHSTVLFGAVLEDGVTLGPLSLVMKGEVLPASSKWAGCPAAPMSAGKGVEYDAGKRTDAQV